MFTCVYVLLCVCVCLCTCVCTTCASVCMLACVCVVQTNEERRVLREGVRWESLGRVAKQRQFPAQLCRDSFLHLHYSFLQSCIITLQYKKCFKWWGAWRKGYKCKSFFTILGTISSNTFTLTSQPSTFEEVTLRNEIRKLWGSRDFQKWTCGPHQISWSSRPWSRINRKD